MRNSPGAAATSSGVSTGRLALLEARELRLSLGGGMGEGVDMAEGRADRSYYFTAARQTHAYIPSRSKAGGVVGKRRSGTTGQRAWGAGRGRPGKEGRRGEAGHSGQQMAERRTARIL